MPPNPACMVCSPKPEILLKLDTGRVTVKALRDDILIKALNMVNPDVMVDGKGIILISSEEGETDDNNDKILKDLSIVDGCVLKVDDFFQNYELTITLIHKDVQRDDASLFEVIARDPSVVKPAVNGAAAAGPTRKRFVDASSQFNISSLQKDKLHLDGHTQTDAWDESLDDVCVIEDDRAKASKTSSQDTPSPDTATAGSSSIRSPPKKRKPAVVGNDQGPLAKRSKTQEEEDDDDDLICMDDD